MSRIEIWQDQKNGRVHHAITNDDNVPFWRVSMSSKDWNLLRNKAIAELAIDCMTRQELEDRLIALLGIVDELA